MDETARDHIDGILAQWRRERPELDTQALGIVGRILRIAKLADARLARGIQPLGLQSGWFDILAALRRAGTPYELNPTDLVRATLLSSGGITKRLDRLADAGLVERRPDPDDRRGTRVRLTAAGKEAVDGAIETHIRNEERLLAALRESERESLNRLLRTLLTTLEADEDGDRGARPQ